MPRRVLPRAADEAGYVRIRGKTWNRLVRELEAARNLVATAPLRAAVGDNGTTLTLDDAGWCFVLSGSGAPPRTGTPPNNLVPGTGTGTLYTWNGSALVRVATLPVPFLNPWSGPVAANRLTRATRRWGRWWAVNEDCVPASGTTATAPRISGFSSTGFSSGFGSTAAGGDQGLAGGGFSAGFGLGGFGGVAISPENPEEPDPPED